MVAIQRVELRVPAPQQQTDLLSLLQPSGAFSGVKPPSASPTEVSQAGPDSAHYTTSTNAVDGPVATAASTVSNAQVPARASADTALRSFLGHVHATGMMVDEPTWRLVWPHPPLLSHHPCSLLCTVKQASRHCVSCDSVACSRQSTCVLCST